MAENHSTRPADPLDLGNLAPLLEAAPIETSAPCRVDLGGTLDIATFHYPLRRLAPCTVNIALDRRTRVTLQPGPDQRIRIAATGIDEATFRSGAAPYDHPLGLMFAVADYFHASGVHIRIDSASPPRSGLGGSSVAAVALVAAFSRAMERMGRPPLSRQPMVLLAHALEQAVAGVPCGMQDHLAAAYGGIHRWVWPARPGALPFQAVPLVPVEALDRLAPCLQVAYLGVTHVSTDVNGTWIRQFLQDRHREHWRRIVALTDDFATAITRGDLGAAALAMNRETALRKAMTPQVLDDLGDRLVAAAVQAGCGARFTGAGGGGCLWALGEAAAVAQLRPLWQALLDERPSAGLLACGVDARGVA